jgi:hypothetical protein
VLKTLPPLAPVFGALRARRYTFQWSSMLALAVLAKGVLRTATERSASRWLAVLEILFALTFFLAAILRARYPPGLIASPGRTSHLWIDALGLVVELVERREIGLCRGNHDVRIGAQTVDNSPRLLQAHRYLAL